MASIRAERSSIDLERFSWVMGEFILCLVHYIAQCHGRVKQLSKRAQDEEDFTAESAEARGREKETREFIFFVLSLRPPRSLR